MSYSRSLLSSSRRSFDELSALVIKSRAVEFPKVYSHARTRVPPDAGLRLQKLNFGIDRRQFIHVIEKLYLIRYDC